MKRKLKPLHVVLAENPDYYFNSNGHIILNHSPSIINNDMFQYFGEEIEVKVNTYRNNSYCDKKWKWHGSWFEEIKEPERHYLYITECEDGSVQIGNSLYKECPFNILGVNTERLTLDHIENGYVPIKERE